MSDHFHRHYLSEQDGAAEARSALRSVGLRVTTPRISVLSLLLLQQRAMSHTEMQEDLPEIDRVTLYRSLDSLAEAGLAHKIIGDDRITRFRFGTAHSTQHVNGQQSHQHGHFQCLRCAKVFCLEQAPMIDLIEAQLRASLRPGFAAQSVEMTIKGWCDQCNESC
ncbi:transcriptional repressor [Undibacterium cyanobacteriorum]|uniref:Transcriptional repressor n=1 Tax=Undibacterium cyanobacteriorum TaxID=3073561 RepID=A0ABY9RID5_9BURK|nr:transcriptional repressor [Undibacterium sp. 20NA77.5]WMW80978.1 transcriptional repressor [Undibacterium sp. 20NA77.5]